MEKSLEYKTIEFFDCLVNGLVAYQKDNDDIDFVMNITPTDYLQFDTEFNAHMPEIYGSIYSSEMFNPILPEECWVEMKEAAFALDKMNLISGTDGTKDKLIIVYETNEKDQYIRIGLSKKTINVLMDGDIADKEAMFFGMIGAFYMKKENKDAE